jgi:hypothetical protein
MQALTSQLTRARAASAGFGENPTVKLKNRSAEKSEGEKREISPSATGVPQSTQLIVRAMINAAWWRLK